MTMPPPGGQPPPYPRRFRWPMRVFLTLFLACIAYRCFAILLPIREWSSEYKVRRYPLRLASLNELAGQLSPTGDEDQPPSLLETADAVWDYWKPWPETRTRARIHTWMDAGRVTACWVNWHLAFTEHVCAIDEGWPMFSPSVSTEKFHTRARLFYEDGSEVVLRQTTEPEDYRHYWRWFHDKRGNYETSADEDNDDGCYGYCNLLLHRYGHNAGGSPLVKIVLFQVKVKFPPPGVEPLAYYEEQNQLTATPPRWPGRYRSDRAHAAVLVVGAGTGVTGGRAVRGNAKLWTPQVLPDFYEFDVARRKGTLLKEEP